MAKLSETLGQNLRRLRRSKDISQADLAQALGVARATVNLYENGRIGISSDLISKMAAFFKIEETDLVASAATPTQDAVEGVTAKIIEQIKASLPQATPAGPDLQTAKGRVVALVQALSEQDAAEAELILKGYFSEDAEEVAPAAPLKKRRPG